MAAIRAVTTDPGFKLPSASAASSLRTANHLLQWGSEPANKPMVTFFAEDLTRLSSNCFKNKCKSQKAKREKMWGSFHQLRSSTSFKSKWVHFLQKSGIPKATPIFYQYVSETMFKELVKQQFPITRAGAEESCQPLTYEEKNALRYTAGYIPRALQR